MNQVRRFHDILLLIGQLNYTWTNTESLLIYLIAGLARVDKETAIVIFLTLNTTRARIEMVERLAKLRRTPQAARREVLAMTDRLAQQAKLRNKYSHCIYSFDEVNKSMNTQLMRIFDAKEEIKYGKIEALDDQEITKVQKCIKDISYTNVAIWNFVRENNYPH